MMSGNLRFGFILGCLIALAPPQAPAAELVLFEASDCVWCEAWDREIGEIYPLTAEARIAPLRRVDIHGERPHDLAHLRGVVFTPTFVLIEDGEEVGIILGYPGKDFFWGLLGMELQKLGGGSKNLTLRIDGRKPAGAQQRDLQ